MDKNLMISNVDTGKLLNGEFNSTHINMCGENKEFSFLNGDSVFDCVVGVLEVDSQNKALFNDDKTLKFNVYVVNDKKIIKSEPLAYSEDGKQADDRMIDNVFPFSDIKKYIISKNDIGKLKTTVGTAVFSFDEFYKKYLL